MGELIVVTGPPGAGKSTVACRLVDRYDPGALVPGDRFFGFVRHGALPPWSPGSDAQNTAVIEAAAAATGRLARHCDVVYDGVVGPWFLDRFLACSGRPALHLVVLLPPLDVCRHRVRTRAGHGFSDLVATAQMWEQFTEAGVDERHLLDALGDPDDTADRIAGLVATGALRVA